MMSSFLADTLVRALRTARRFHFFPTYITVLHTLLPFPSTIKLVRQASALCPPVVGSSTTWKCPETVHVPDRPHMPPHALGIIVIQVPSPSQALVHPPHESMSIISTSRALEGLLNPPFLFSSSTDLMRVLRRLDVSILRC